MTVSDSPPRSIVSTSAIVLVALALLVGGVALFRAVAGSDDADEGVAPRAAAIDLGERQPGEPPLGEVEIYRGGPSLLPEADLRPTPEEEASLYAIENDAIRSCLQDAGFSVGAFPDVDFSQFPGLGRRYGLSSLQQAEVYGYRLAPTPDEAQVRSFLAGLTDEESRALDRCGRQARRAIGRDHLFELDGRLSDVTFVAYDQAIVDSRAQRVARAWSECMDERGYDYASPSDAMGDPRWYDGEEQSEPSEAEIATAVADVECKLRTNYVGVLQAIEAAYQQEILAEHGSLVEAYRAQLDRILALAG